MGSKESSTVQCKVITSDLTTGSFFVEVFGDSGVTPGVLSWYEVSDELFEFIEVGAQLVAGVDRLENGAYVLMAPVKRVEESKE